MYVDRTVPQVMACTQSLDQAQVSPRNCFFVTCSMKILGGAHFTDLINSY